MYTSAKAGPSDHVDSKDEDLPSYDEVFGSDPNAATLLQGNDSLELQFKYAGYMTTNICVLDSFGKVRYFAEMSEIKDAPDVVLRDRAKDGPIVGTSHFRLKRDIEMYLGGDGTNAGVNGQNASMTTKDTLTYAKYTLTIPRGNDKRVFDVVRTSAKEDGVKGAAARMAYYNYKIVDHVTGKWVGVWLENGSVSFKKGKLRIQVGGTGPDAKPVLMEDEVHWIIMAMASMAEKTRRRAFPYAGIPAAITKFL